MSTLRKQLETAASEYRTAVYEGDLASELLGKPMRISAAAAPAWRRFMPLALGAMAAMIAIVFWPHRTGPVPIRQIAIVDPAHAAVPFVWPAKLTRLHAPHYETYVTDMRSGMREAVSQLSDNMDGALDAPLVSGSVQTVRHVAGELQEFALVTWSQLRPRRDPGC